jgi:hypothetical protein
MYIQCSWEGIELRDFINIREFTVIHNSFATAVGSTLDIYILYIYIRSSNIKLNLMRVQCSIKGII